MALLTTVEVGGGRELPLVFVLVTVEAAREFHLVKRFSTLGDVALRTLHGRMLGLKGIRRCRMLLHTELGGFESLHRVASGAFPSVRALDELALVLISMAVHAALESNRLLEIAGAVALHAINALVLAHQRILGFRVIKILVERGTHHPLPTGSVVATLAALLGKTPAVRISVAIQTFCKRQPHVPRLIVCSGSVALLAGHLGMQAG